MAYKTTLFSQVLQVVPGLRFKFEEIVEKYNVQWEVRGGKVSDNKRIQEGTVTLRIIGAGQV